MNIFRHIYLTLLLLPIGIMQAQDSLRLPVIRITYNTLFSQSFTSGTMMVETPDSAHFEVEVRHRGRTSLKMTKPSLSVKIVDSLGNKLDTTFFGLRKDNYWVLDAMASDKARARNRASMDLWLEMSRKPWYQEQEPDCINGYRGKMVDVYINERHMGIYHLTERIDRKQLKLKKYNAAKGGIRGLLYNAESWTATYPFYYYIRPLPGDSVDHWYGWAIDYPKWDEGDSITWQPLINFMEYVRTKSYTVIQPAINDYIDMPVYIDYVLLISMLSANDNGGKNTYWSYYDQTISNKALISLWDMDHSWGRKFNGDEENTSFEHNDKMYVKLLKTPAFRDSLYQRYAELRQHIFTVQHLDSVIGKYLDLYQQTGMDAVEKELWDGVDNLSLDIPSERAYIHNWLVKRIAFTDSLFQYHAHVYPIEGITRTEEYFSIEEKERCQRMNLSDSTITLIFSPDRFDVPRDSIIHSVFAYGTFTAWQAPLADYQLTHFSADSCFYTTLPFSMLERPGDEGQPDLYFRVYYSDEPDTDTLFMEPMPIDSGSIRVDSRLSLRNGGIMLLWPGDDINELGARVDKIWEYAGLDEWLLDDNIEAQEQFANFRQVPGTKHLYRSFHPFYPIITDETAGERVQRVAQCAERVGIESAICLSSNQTNAVGTVLPCGDSTYTVVIPDYYQSIIDGEHVLYVGQSIGFRPSYQNTLWFPNHGHYGEWMAELVHFVCDTANHVPFQMHCSLGADRTGSFSAVIAALCGASWEDIAADYEATSNTRDQLYRHRRLISYTLRQMLGERPEDIANLQEAMIDYFMETGELSRDEIFEFVERLNSVPQTPTDIHPEEEQMTTTKRLLNGHLIIERNGKRYSILGTSH